MAKHPMDNIEPGIKVTAQMSPRTERGGSTIHQADGG